RPADRRWREGRRARTGAEPPAGGGDLCPGFAVERAAQLRLGAGCGRNGGRHRSLAAAPFRRHAGRRGRRGAPYLAARGAGDGDADAGDGRQMKRLRSLLAALIGVVVALPVSAGAVDIKPVTTPLGLKVWLVQDKSAPVVALAFSFAGGTASDPVGQTGVTNL